MACQSAFILFLARMRRRRNSDSEEEHEDEDLNSLMDKMG